MGSPLRSRAVDDDDDSNRRASRSAPAALPSGVSQPGFMAMKKPSRAWAASAEAVTSKKRARSVAEVTGVTFTVGLVAILEWLDR